MVVDDTAVTPQYVHGVAAQRELPIIKKIAIGSLRNKLLFILPAALLLSQFVPLAADADPDGRRHLPLLRGRREDLGTDLRPPATQSDDAAEQAEGPDEATVVSGAIRTDFILSAEIMVIALNEVADQPFVSRAVILVVVAIAITILVYGVVALIVKMDDVGLRLVERGGNGRAGVGRGLVAAMPRLLAVISDRRHRGDAVGRRPHPARRGRRPRLARAVRRGAPPRARGRTTRGTPWVPSWAGWSTPLCSAVVGLLSVRWWSP